MAVIEQINGGDPLSDAACAELIAYGREDEYVDFKREFAHKSDKAWIDLAVDCVAFANTQGGFVVFGVEEGTWTRVGLTDEAATALEDPKRVLEKINRNLVPALTRVKSRIYRADGGTFAIVAVPASESCTHIFETNLDWSPKAGKTLTLVPKGAIYVRRAGSNQVLTAVDFEELVDRRIRKFREKILEGMTRVVQAPMEEEVITVKAAEDPTGAVELTVGSAPEAMRLAGKPVRMTVHSIVDKIALYRDLVPEHGYDGPGRKLCLEAYIARGSLDPPLSVSLWLAVQSLVDGLPAFRWLAALDAEAARKAIRLAFSATYRKEHVAYHAFFYGDRFVAEMCDRLRTIGKHLGQQVRDNASAFKAAPSTDREDDERDATDCAKRLLVGRDAQTEYRLIRLDCALYAPW